MTNSLKLGSKVRLRHDDGWDAPGCVIAHAGDKLRVFWPDVDEATDHLPADLVLDSASQPRELVA